MLTHFKSILITSENIEESHEQFHKLFGHDTSDIGNDNDLKIYNHSLKNGSIELYENRNQKEHKDHDPRQEEGWRATSVSYTHMTLHTKRIVYI